MGEGAFAVGTGGSFMKFFFVFFLKIDVIHFATLEALFDVASAISEVGGYFGLWEHLKAVLAHFHRLGHVFLTN